jgi:hypothetical protein
VSISLAVQSQNHGNLRLIMGEIEPLGRFSVKLPSTMLLRGVHPYGETYFNMIQLGFLIEQIDELVEHYPDQTAMLEVIAEAAREAIRARGYLKFSGD